MRPSIVAASKRPKPYISHTFLPRRVPQLQSNRPPLYINSLAFLPIQYQLHSNRIDEPRAKGVIRVPHDQAGLPHSRVSNGQDLEQVVTA